MPLQKQPLYCAPSWAWPSVSGRIELLPLVGVDTSVIDQKSIDIGAKVEEVHLFYEGKPVSVARSLVDDGNFAHIRASHHSFCLQGRSFGTL